MYGTALGASVTTASAVILPETKNDEILTFIVLVCLAIGVAITAIAVTRVFASRFFNR